MLRSPFHRRVLWASLAAAIVAASATFLTSPEVPVRALPWPLLWFAAFKVLIIRDVGWQKLHDQEHYQRLLELHGGVSGLRAYVGYRLAAVAALSIGAVVCFVATWSG